MVEECKPVGGGPNPKGRSTRLPPARLSVNKKAAKLSSGNHADFKSFQEYQQSGATGKLEAASGTSRLVPWLVLSKPEGEGVNHRLTQIVES